MPKFLLELIPSIRGKIKFYQLKKDGECEFENFCNEIERNGQYDSELRTIFSLMDYFSNLNRLPKSKLNPITPAKEIVKEYEFKSKHLRVYFIHVEQKGEVIICGGYKNTQPEDIQHFRSIKKQFLNTI